jgi:hypothetical protein
MPPPPPPPPLPPPPGFRGSRSPGSAAPRDRRQGPKHPEVASADHSRPHAVHTNPTKDRESIFSLDLKKVMREFDRGWDISMSGNMFCSS